MRQKQDPWKKPRGPGNHFTLEELVVIEAAFVAELKPVEIAEQLRCSQRSVNRCFARLRAGDPRKDTREAVPVVEAKRAPVDRFYHGSFDL